MEIKPQKLRKPELKFLQEDRKSIIIGTVIATFIAMTPYLFYLYESVPDVKDWNTFFGTYHSGSYESANISMWVLNGKIIPLFLIVIWFFTCRHWWYHALLVPISMYVYQIFTTLNDDAKFVDNNQLIYLIPVIAIIVPSIYLIRARIFNKVNSANQTMQELEDEFKMTPKSFWDTVKQYF